MKNPHFYINILFIFLIGLLSVSCPPGQEESIPDISLELAGTWNLTNSEHRGSAIYVDGSYAYVATCFGGLVVLDIDDRTNPTETGRYSEPDVYVYDVQVTGNYAYVADWYSSLKIVDISSPGTPALIVSYERSGSPQAAGIFVNGNYVYLADHGGLDIVNVSQVNDPQQAGFLDVPTAFDVYVVDNYAYVAAWEEGLQIINISDKANPFIAGYIDTPGDAKGIFVKGNYAYVADSDSGIQIINISNPGSPFIAGSYDTPDYARRIFIDDTIAYVADSGSGIIVLDVSTPPDPKLITTFDTPGEIEPGNTSGAQDVYVDGHYLYVTNWDQGMQIIEIIQ